MQFYIHFSAITKPGPEAIMETPAAGFSFTIPMSGFCHFCPG
ncbi:hypothetical protein HMPREF1548_04977 [Clostridium sp. KLE 1755]|nr:hypothetical protein HMPREF1548_04977 [Clostridium sp. KLE 1755]